MFSYPTGASIQQMGSRASRFARLPAAGVLGWLAAIACSATASHPPDLGDCSGIEGGCPVSAVIGGGGGGSHDDAGTTATGCAVSALDSQCTQCANASCCTPFAACENDVDCENLSSCEENCFGVSACISGCEREAPNGINLLSMLDACVAAKCIVCSQSGVGDPCDPAANACNAGLSCRGEWCTKPCTRSSDCAGLGAGGGNALNLPNACVENPATGETCTPGCNVDADCAASPATFCFATTSTEGVQVRICSPTPDAGRD